MPTEAQIVCQQIANTHYFIATREDQQISRYDSVLYRNSQRSLIAAIRFAYGLSALKAQRAYDVWVDCTEPILYCVDQIR
jgi:hypothetical protein